MCFACNDFGPRCGRGYIRNVGVKFRQFLLLTLSFISQKLDVQLAEILSRVREGIVYPLHPIPCWCSGRSQSISSNVSSCGSGFRGHGRPPGRHGLYVSLLIVLLLCIMFFILFTVFSFFIPFNFYYCCLTVCTPPTKSLWTVLPAVDSTLTLRLFQQVAVGKHLYVNQSNKFCLKGHILYC